MAAQTHVLFAGTFNKRPNVLRPSRFLKRQIEAWRKFQIPDELVEGYGYPKITPEIRRKVFGENAARIWDIDKDKAMQAKSSLLVAI